MSEDRTLEELSRVACERHLRQERVGRIALMVGDHPEIFPLNYVADRDGALYFRTDPGTKLDALAGAQRVAFEIDGIDEQRQGGWSVLVVGTAHRVGDPREIEHVAGLDLEPWAAGERANVIKLVPDKITGRHLRRRVATR